MVCNKHKFTTKQLRVKLTQSPDNGEGFFVDFHVVSLRSRQRSRCEGDRAFGAVRKHVLHHCADAVRRGIAGEAQRQGWVKMGEHQVWGDLSFDFVEGLVAGSSPAPGYSFLKQCVQGMKRCREIWQEVGVVVDQSQEAA